MGKFMWIFVVCLLLAGFGFAEEEEITPEKQAEIAEALKPSLVKVLFTLQYDKGEEPYGAGWGERCSGCGNYHSTSLKKFVRDERPLETKGFVLSPTQVLTKDVMTHPRFIKSIEVEYNNKKVKAEYETYIIDQNAGILKLASPLEGIKPLKFDAEKTGPYFVVGYARLNTEWKVSVKGFSGVVTVSEKGRKVRTAPSFSIIIDKTGVPAAVSMKGELPVDDSWKGTPLKWKGISRREYTDKLSQIGKTADNTLLRVKLNFRSPKKKAGGRSGRMRSYSGDDDDGSATEKNTLGLVVKKDLVLVLANLDLKTTARLEKVTIYPPQGDPISAKFSFTLIDYGAFGVIPEKPLAAALSPVKGDIRELRTKLLYGAEIRIRGEARIKYVNQIRIAGFDIGRRSNIFPDMAGDDENLYLFTEDGEFIASPIAERRKGERQNRYSYREGGKKLTPYVYVLDALKNPDKNYDPHNIPLSEEEENRLAWMGVELQALNTQLARVNNVSKYSQDGEFGAIISYVYKNSPADKLGIKQGNILLRIHVEGEPKPLNIKLDRDGSQFAFPWDRLDQLPEQYFERIPIPWQSVETGFARSLTDYGFNRKYKGEFFIDGKIVFKNFVIEQSPPYYDMAKKFKSKELGITTRNITYELRRYFQMKKEDPGVIISKIEPGSKASVAGLKPYEIITHIDDKPVQNVSEIEKLSVKQGELRLNVKRMSQNRVVKIKIGDQKKKPKSNAERGTRNAE
ncbi:PDZ domain-containing protein [Planctomycetota bacterium]